jgi:DNA-binding beta-propeller fold protein YncE
MVLRKVGEADLARLPENQGRVLEPAGVAADAFGRILVSDAAAHRLQRYQRSFAWIGEMGGLGSDPGQLRRPGSVAVVGTLGIAVLDRENRRVVTYDHFGRRIGVAIELAEPTLELQIGRVDPSLLAADLGGAIAILDPERERLLTFDFSGRFQRAIGGFGPRPGQMRGTAGLAFAPKGDLVVAERIGARVQRIDADGRAVASWPLSVKRGAGLLPVAVDEQGRVAVADEDSGRLWVFGADGRTLARASGLARPRALAFDPDGSLIAVEGAPPARLRRFRLETAAPAPAE